MNGPEDDEPWDRAAEREPTQRAAHDTIGEDWDAEDSAVPWRSEEDGWNHSLPELPSLKGLARGDHVGRYEIRRLLGSGGAGRVYCAFDPELDREVALKVLTSHGTAGASKQRLIREARAMASLSHPNVVEVHHVGQFDDAVFIAMELLGGGTLTEWIFDAPREYAQVLDKFVAAGRGLAHAHAAGMVHRDFKPDNVLLGADGVPRVVDFGLARSEDGGTPSPDERRPRDTLEPISGHSAMLGTPAYMAPEQHLGGKVDARADQFGFAVSVYEALYGRRPFAGRSLAELAMAVTTEDPEDPPTDRGVPPRVYRVLRRALARRPSDRWPHMEALLSALTIDRQGTIRWAVGGLGLVAAVGVVVGLTPDAGEGPAPCDVGAARVDAVWSGARRDAVGEAFSATDLAYAADAQRGVADRVQTWSLAWREAYGRACQAARVDHASTRSADLQMRCLTRQLDEVDALVAVLATADAGVVRRAAELAAQIPPTAACEDVRRLRAHEERGDADALAELAQARLRSAEIRALQTAGRVDEALIKARALQDSATPESPVRVRAEGHLRLGIALERHADYERARHHLVEAEHIAAAAELDAIAIEAGVELTYVTGYRLSRPEEGLRWARATGAAIERSGGDPRAEVRLLNNEATLHERRGDYEGALQAFGRARAMHEANRGPGHPDVARILINMGLLLNRLDRPEHAQPLLSRAVELLVAARGPDHPSLVMALNNLGVALEHQGRLQDAAQRYHEAVRVGERALGPAHADIVSTLNNLSNIAVKQGDLDAAERFVRRGLAIREQTYGADHPRTAFSARTLGGVLARKDQIEPALALHRRALAIFESELGPTHPECAATMAEMGCALGHANRVPEALTQFNSALRLRRDRFGDDHPEVARTQLLIGQAHARAGDMKQAQQWFDLAAPALQALAPDDPDRIEAAAGPQSPTADPFFDP